MTEIIHVRRRAAATLIGFGISLALGACFNGENAIGLYCLTDEQCGNGQSCIDNYCEGVFFCENEDILDAQYVCDGIEDCVDGEDEEPVLCLPPDELFECSDGQIIPLEWFCDGEPDCEDDEVECEEEEEEEEEPEPEGNGLNQCSGMDAGPDLAYEFAADGGEPMDEPLPLQLVQLRGPMEPEAVVADDDGTVLQIIELLGGMDGMPPPPDIILGPFGERTIADFAVGDVNDDELDDIVIATEGADGFAAYVFQNNAPSEDPSEYGIAQPITLPGGVVPDIDAIALGRLDNDASTDMVAIVDGGQDLGAGLMLVARGDSNAAAEGGAYFTPQLLDSVVLNYDMFFDMVMADVDGNSYDDVIISGDGGNGPNVWVIYRDGEAELLSGWSEPTPVSGMLEIKPAELTIAHFNVNNGPDLVAADPIQGRFQTFLNMNGELVSKPAIDPDLSDDLLGVSASDVNCDGHDDFLFYQQGGVAVLLGDGMGELDDADPVITTVEGNGYGRIGVAQYDDDGTPDLVITAVGGPPVQLLLSSGYEFPEDEDEDEDGAE